MSIRQTRRTTRTGCRRKSAKRHQRQSNGRSEMTEYYHTLLENGGRLLKDGEVVHETDYQILGHKNNEAQTPPEKKWIGWKKTQGFPHPAFVRMPEGFAAE